MNLESNEYARFCSMYVNNGYPEKRFGQAFWVHFNMSNIIEAQKHSILCELKDDVIALNYVSQNFIFY